ncbi:MAG TPA: hypothetical protein VHZ55_07940 [Bryobacteraceae bacterium]|jgi:hypothetical protein|nr:hypothetical protein [Bryobacteraceae bacterium]
MGQASGKVLEVKCPCCEATLQIDTEMELVINHKEAERKPLIEDLQSAAQALKGEAARRNDAFEKSFASHLSSDKLREKKFEELLRQAKERPDAPLPKRPFDLD